MLCYVIMFFCRAAMPKNDLASGMGEKATQEVKYEPQGKRLLSCCLVFGEKYNLSGPQKCVFRVRSTAVQFT